MDDALDRNITKNEDELEIIYPENIRSAKETQEL